MTSSRPVLGYRLSSDPSDLDPVAIHAFLSNSYWRKGDSLDLVERSIRGSFACVGAFDKQGRQVGFCRAVSDGATFAYIADVYVLEEHRSRGLASWMLFELLASPDLTSVHRTMLATRDAHSLYERLGFEPLKQPERWMEKQ